jgi:S-formylglutathione hydrolase FrmB
VATTLLIICLAVATASPPAATQPSRIELQTHFSSLLAREKHFNIFLPDGYDSESCRYPTVYLFRGHEREWANPTEDGSRQGNIKTVADALYASGVIGKMLLVMPGLDVSSGPPDDLHYRYVLEELMPYVDSHFRTRPTRWQRGIDGFSYGGLSVIELLWRRPLAVATAGAYDGSFFAFDLNLFASAPESVWALLRPITYLIHAAVLGGTNYAVTQQFIGILNAHGVQNTFSDPALTSNAQHNWFFADHHMHLTLPVHWETFAGGPQNLPVTVIAPAPGSRLEGTTEIIWSRASHPDSTMTVVETSSDRGRTWHDLIGTSMSDTGLTFNTTLFPDGTRYLFRISVYGDTLYGTAVSGGAVTIDNPGNGPPDLEIFAPLPGDRLSGTVQVILYVADAEGDQVTVSLEASPDDGSQWLPVVSGIMNPTTIPWDTRGFPNSSSFRLRVTGKDGTDSTQVVSERFNVLNPRPALIDTLVRHTEGSADAVIHVNVVEPTALTGHRYRVSFRTDAGLAYTVADLATGDTLFRAVAVPEGVEMEGPAFDGVRLHVRDVDSVGVLGDSTGWVIGSSTLIPAIVLPRFDPGTGPITGVPYPADYQITITDVVADTSSASFGWEAVPMKFRVRNVTEGRDVEVLFTDIFGNGELDYPDDITILEPDSVGELMPSWALSFAGSPTAVPPVAGDVFRLRIRKPLTERDVYEFTASPEGVTAVVDGLVPLTTHMDVNYPNPFNAATTIRYVLGGDVGKAGVRLSVFDILGREVTVLVNERQGPGVYLVRVDASGWSSGMYFCRLMTGGTSLTRKMILTK